MNVGTMTEHGQRVLVTGGAGGIGWAICQALAEDGARIALADIDGAAARSRVDELGPGHVALQADLIDRDVAAALPGRAAQALGGLDVIVNNAGMTDTSGKPLIELPAAAFDRLVALNLTAVATICAEAPKVLRDGSRIVNLASGASWRPLALRGPYSATKAGIVALTKALAADYRSRGIAVSAVAPGYTLTPLVASLAAEGLVDLDKVAAAIPMGRLATPEDIAAAVAFAAGPDGRVLSGETVLVDGGGLAGPAPEAAGPAPGTVSDGVIAALHAPEVLPAGRAGGILALTDRSEIETAGPLRALVDFEALSTQSDPGTTLANIRETAIRAANADRSRDFALLFVFGEGAGPGGTSSVAAGRMMAQTIALEWAPSGLRVNALEWRGSVTDGIGPLCRFLIGAGAAHITGQSLRAGPAPGRGGN